MILLSARRRIVFDPSDGAVPGPGKGCVSCDGNLGHVGWLVQNSTGKWIQCDSVRPHPTPRAYPVEQIEPRDRIRSPPHSLPHTGTAAGTVLRRYVHRRPRARRGCLRAGGLEWFFLPSGVPGFHECSRFRHRQAGLDIDKAGEEKEDGDGDRYEVCSETTSG